MNMMHRIEGNLIFAKLDKGEDVFPLLRD
jgi:hypothetical protein